MEAQSLVIEAFPLVNVAELNRGLDALGLGAIVCRAGMNVTYLSGISSPGTLGRLLDLTDSPREIFVVWPRHGSAVVVLNHIAAPLARATGWIPNLRVYGEYVESPASAVASVLEDLKLGKERIGFDMRWLGAARWNEFTKLLNGATLVDCTDVLDETRALKTPAELDKLKLATDVMDMAYKDVFGTIRAGETERVIHGRIIRRLLELKTLGPHGILHASTNPVVYGGESDLPVARGDRIRTDYVAYAENYAANLSRVVSVGPASSDLRGQYRNYLSAYREAAELLRPAVTAGEVFTSVGSVFREHGLPVPTSLVGHGIGAWWHQQEPILAEGNPRLLKPGMVFALEPVSGFWHLQDEFVITANGSRLLSDGFDISEMFETG